MIQFVKGNYMEMLLALMAVFALVPDPIIIILIQMR